eukprot:symbB.v1.2.016300.t1/scaffold1237.1/size130094/1
MSQHDVSRASRQKAKASDFIFSRVSGDGKKLICDKDTPLGAPLLAIPCAQCWTKETAEQCPALRVAVTLAERRNPSCEVLKRDSTWIALHLLHERKYSTEKSIDLQQIFGDAYSPLRSWSDQDFDHLKGSFWCEEGKRRKRRMQMDYLELLNDGRTKHGFCQEELGPEVSDRLGLTESGYYVVMAYLASHAFCFDGIGLVLVPGFTGAKAGTIEEESQLRYADVQLVHVKGRAMVVALASKSYAQGDLVRLHHRQFCVSSGARLLAGLLDDDLRSLRKTESLWEDTIITMTFVTTVTTEIVEELKQHLTDDLENMRPPYKPGLCRCHDVPPVEIHHDRSMGTVVTVRVRVFGQRPMPSSKCLELLGRLALLDHSERRKDMMMLECAWDGIETTLACQQRGLRILLEEMQKTLAKYPHSRELEIPKACERQQMCCKVLAAERQ